ncbi:MAG: beta-ketoacyl-ACP synthase 3 [Armatimonadota bacterium]
MLRVKIAGLGSYLPSQVVTSTELEQQLGIASGWIARVTGVRERRYVTDETTVGMAAIAAKRALDQAGLAAKHLDAIVGASTGAQQIIPCTAALVQKELGAPEGRSVCFDVNATCLSFAVALQNIAHLIAAGVYHTVLVFSSEIGRHSRNPHQPESAVLFGDAAAAAIVTRAAAGETGAILHTRFSTYSSAAHLTQFLGGGTLHHPNDPATTPEMNMFSMNGPGVFKHAARLSKRFVSEMLAAVGWLIEDVDIVIPHQASRHAVDLLTKQIGFPAERIFTNLATRGNCIAASIPLAMAEAKHAGLLHPGQRVLLIGTGAGLTIGGIAMIY